MDIVLTYDIGQAGDAGVPCAVKRHIQTQYSPLSQESRIPNLMGFSGTIIETSGIGEPMIPRLYPSLGQMNISGYQYTIITSEELKPAFERLVALRRQKGMDAGIITMEYIRSLHQFDNGDEVSGINDDAGRLRAFLTYLYENKGTEYVILGGAPEHVPFRYGTGEIVKKDGLKPIGHLKREQIPSDLYFAEFNQNWNLNNDNQYGYINDFDIDSIDNCFDHSQEISLGRLLCRDRAEVNNYINKVEIYELNPGNGNRSYLNNTCYFIGAEFKYCIPILNNFMQNIFSETQIYQQQDKEDRHPTGSESISFINSFNPAAISFNCHGNPMGLQTAYTSGGGFRLWYKRIRFRKEISY